MKKLLIVFLAFLGLNVMAQQSTKEAIVLEVRTNMPVAAGISGTTSNLNISQYAYNNSQGIPLGAGVSGTTNRMHKVYLIKDINDNRVFETIPTDEIYNVTEKVAYNLPIGGADGIFGRGTEARIIGKIN